MLRAKIFLIALVWEDRAPVYIKESRYFQLPIIDDLVVLFIPHEGPANTSW
jgi:hypothetical protein